MPTPNVDRAFPWEDTREVVTFSTPEQIEVSYRVATFGSRMLGVLIDIALIHILIIAVTLGGILLGLNLGSALSPELVAYMITSYLILVFILKFLYFSWAELQYDGHTIGKRMVKTRTVMLSGHGITLGASLIRNLARIIDHIPIAWLVPALTQGHRRIGDLLAGTIVIDEAETDDITPAQASRAASHRDLADKLFHISAASLARLVADDLNLIEHLFHRASVIDDQDSREELFRSVAVKYVNRLGCAEQRALIADKPRQFLEELYLALRDRLEQEHL